jgi:sporulation protein YlmC with PRC-barrel domain
MDIEVLYLLSSEALKGKKVVGSGGLMIGETEGFLIDLKSWKVAHLQIGLTDEVAKLLGQKTTPFGIGKVGITSKVGIKKASLSMPVDNVDQVGDIIIVKSGIKELQAMSQAPASATM